MAPNLMQVPYDNERSFAAIGLVAAQPMIMVAGRSHPARTLAEYVARARANPGRETCANAGTGSSTHLAAELFFQEARLDVLDVGYRGSGPAIQAVISGESGMLILLAASALMGFIKSGEIRLLASVWSYPSGESFRLPTTGHAPRGVNAECPRGISCRRCSAVSYAARNLLLKQMANPRSAFLSWLPKSRLAASGRTMSLSVSPGGLRLCPLTSVE
jgi:hypothetical protein